jgi:cytochrome c-type biogenesis protein CcmE
MPMDPSRKRRIRLFAALTAAVLLAGGLVWTSFGAASETRSPSQLQTVSAPSGRTFQLTGKVVAGYTRDGTVTNFRVRDRSGSASVPVRYAGALPDPFQAGREVIVNVRKQGDVWVGQPNSLVTKCPSKFTAEQKS